MKSQRSIIERVNDLRRVIAMAEHDKLPRAQIKVFHARYETLMWVLDDSR